MTRLNISGMKCMGCVGSVKNALESIDGIGAVVVDLDSGSARYEGDVDAAEACRVVTEAGYPAQLAEG